MSQKQVFIHTRGGPDQASLIQACAGSRLKTRHFEVKTKTGSSFWFRVVLLALTIAWFGFVRDGIISRISLSTRNVSPARVGFGHVISPPKPIIPFARGSPPTTRRRIVIAAVCQPLAANPRKMLPSAAVLSR